jgi:hypothetical protein
MLRKTPPSPRHSMKHRTWRRPNWLSVHRPLRRGPPSRGARGAWPVWSVAVAERCLGTSAVRQCVAPDRAANDVHRQMATHDPPCARNRATRGRSHRSCEPGQFRRTPPPYALPPARTWRDTPARVARSGRPENRPARATSQGPCFCSMLWRMMGGRQSMSLPPIASGQESSAADAAVKR